ncbi:PEP-CTERM sorting domain-containing protein [Luteolibacter algae]|uniref:PEP-CTERM sorting domain-containing protein n=1 Tax=Luteolibacter algae TaxID=454151 RepID=A0ABW5D3X8_9BACT
MKKIIITLAGSLVISAGSQAALLINGDFSNTSINGASGGPNHLQYNALGLGWTVKNSTAWSAAAENATKTGDNQFGIAQANMITTETGSNFTISFDWTAPAAALTADNLTLDILVVAHKLGTDPLADDRFFTGLNFESYQSRAVGTGGTWIDLSDGSVKTGNGNSGGFTAVGVAGATMNFSRQLNFGGTNIEDYDVLSVKFFYGGPAASDAIGGGIIDNVTISVPEPSVLGLSSLGIAGLLIRRRRG